MFDDKKKIWYYVQGDEDNPIRGTNLTMFQNGMLKGKSTFPVSSYKSIPLEIKYQLKIFWKWLEKEDYKNLKWMLAQIIIPIATFLLGILLGKLKCS